MEVITRLVKTKYDQSGHLRDTEHGGSYLEGLDMVKKRSPLHSFGSSKNKSMCLSQRVNQYSRTLIRHAMTYQTHSISHIPV